MIERFDLRDVPAQPWKNGAGLTREIARGGIDASDFDWRLSLAEVERDAPFSAFPGIDRCIVLLSGGGMRLKSSDGSVDHALTVPLTPFFFSGDVPLDATLEGGPSSDFNVMTRRGLWRSEVMCHRSEISVQQAPIVFALCVDGEWVAETDEEPQRLEPLQCLLWRESATLIRIWPAYANAKSSLLIVRLCHDSLP